MAKVLTGAVQLASLYSTKVAPDRALVPSVLLTVTELCSVFSPVFTLLVNTAMVLAVVLSLVTVSSIALLLTFVPPERELSVAWPSVAPVSVMV